jgi:hypothetical protein
MQGLACGARQAFRTEDSNVPVEQQPPAVLALIVADYVHRDDHSGAFTILATRSAIGAKAFPWTRAHLAVYAVLTDGRSETTLQLRLVDVEAAREPVLEHETVVQFLDPTDDVEIVFRLSDLVFPEPGDYRIQLLAAGQLLCERRILLIPLESPDSR